LLVLAERCIDDAHVEQDLGGIRDPVKGLERLIELIVVVELEGLDPCLDFLLRARVSRCSAISSRRGISQWSHEGLVHLTCFNDMLSQVLQLQRLSKPGSLAALGIAEP
jgi:hypothetical protein